MFWGLVILGIIGAIAGGLVWWFKPAYYTAEMTVTYVHYEKKIYADMLHKLDLLIQAGDMTQLSRLLDINENDAGNLLYIHSFNIRKEPLREDLSTEKIPFYIEVGVKDSRVLAELQLALINYLNNTEYIQSRQKFMKEKSKEELRFLEHRLAIADSLSRLNVIRMEGIKDEKVLTRMELLEESMAIYARMQELEGSLKFNLNLEVLDGFIPVESGTGRSIAHFLLLGFLAGLGFRFVIRIFQ
jgi:hypothetical protein